MDSAIGNANTFVVDDPMIQRTAMVLMTALTVACGGLGARAPVVAPVQPAPSIQAMYEAGQDEQVVAATTAESAAAPPLAILAGRTERPAARSRG